MNIPGISLLWCVVQATLFTSLGLAVYFIARRRGPAVAATAVTSTLVVLAVVSALAFSPWPRWYTFGPNSPVLPGGSDVDLVAGRETPATRAGATDGETNRPAATDGLTSTKALVADAWQVFWNELRRTPATEAQADSWRWPNVVVVVFLSGVALALGRVFLGWWAMRRYRAGMAAVSDPALQAQAALIARQMGCQRPVELRQSATLHTPATIGWRRPIVILPSDWPSWNETERQVVLAHEIAHVARGDYAIWLIAQLSVALHFYHPLVHWLARRLRLEQELAADAWAAALTGSRETYLMTLAQMALRQDDRAIAWAARGFLPTRGAFLRRIEMLRENKPLANASPSPRRAALLTASVALAGLLIAGVRGPDNDRPSAQAAPPLSTGNIARPAASNDGKPFDLSFVSSRAVAVLAVRPAEILARPGMQSVAKLLNEGGSLEQNTGLKTEKIEEFRIMVTRLPEPNSGRRASIDESALQLMRYREPFDWNAKVGPNLVGRPVAAEVAGKTYYHSERGDSATRPAFYVADERTLVFGPEIDVQRAIIEAGKRKPAWSQRWEQLAKGQAALMVDLEAIGRAAGDEVKRPPLVAFAPVWEQGKRLFLSAQLVESFHIAAHLDCANADDAKRVQETMQAVLTLARNALDEADRKLASGPAAQATALLPLLDMASDALKQGTLEIEDSTVAYSTKADLNAAETAASLLAPAVMAARASASRAQASNNMKQLMLALYNYMDVNKHFPPPVVIGPDGKTPHSWRIEILPYLGQDALYRQYRMDEPWDSENNQRVLDKMPVQLRDPAADSNSKETSYFALIGPTTFFGAKGSRGTTLAEILDGTSNTIAIVEAKRSVPWTKPEDIEYDADKPLPKFGGIHPGGFIAGFGDGSVHFLSETLDERTVRNLITRADGEAVRPLP